MVVLIGLALLLLAGCGREFDGPYAPSSPEYAGYAWARDFDGNGVSDSVDKYAPGCTGTPETCLEQAQTRYLALADTTPEPAKPKDVRVDSIAVTDLTLSTGETKPAKVRIFPADATSPNYEMSSQDGDVAVVKPGGVYGAGTGNTMITVRALDGSEKTARFRVTVTQKQP